MPQDQQQEPSMVSCQERCSNSTACPSKRIVLAGKADVTTASPSLRCALFISKGWFTVSIQCCLLVPYVNHVVDVACASMQYAHAWLCSCLVCSGITRTCLGS